MRGDIRLTTNHTKFGLGRIILQNNLKTFWPARYASQTVREIAHGSSGTLQKPAERTQREGLKAVIPTQKRKKVEFLGFHFQFKLQHVPARY